MSLGVEPLAVWVPELWHIKPMFGLQKIWDEEKRVGLFDYKMPELKSEKLVFEHFNVLFTIVRTNNTLMRFPWEMLSMVLI